jgi:hypothetical protein
LDSKDDALANVRATTAVLHLKQIKGSTKIVTAALLGRDWGQIVKPDIVTARVAINNFIKWEFGLGIIIIIIITCDELGLNRPVSASSNSLFKRLPSRLRPFGL